jgi:hypothetical protein
MKIPPIIVRLRYAIAAVLGLLFFLAAFFLAPRGPVGTPWPGYWPLLVFPESEPSAVELLKGQGVSNVISRSTVKEQVSIFSGMEDVRLLDIGVRLLPDDPRNSPYFEKALKLFDGQLRNKAASVIYIPRNVKSWTSIEKILTQNGIEHELAVAQRSSWLVRLFVLAAFHLLLTVSSSKARGFSLIVSVFALSMYFWHPSWVLSGQSVALAWTAVWYYKRYKGWIRQIIHHEHFSDSQKQDMTISTILALAAAALAIGLPALTEPAGAYLGLSLICVMALLMFGVYDFEKWQAAKYIHKPFCAMELENNFLRMVSVVPSVIVLSLSVFLPWVGTWGQKASASVKLPVPVEFRENFSQKMILSLPEGDYINIRDYMDHMAWQEGVAYGRTRKKLTIDDGVTLTDVTASGDKYIVEEKMVIRFNQGWMDKKLATSGPISASRLLIAVGRPAILSLYSATPAFHPDVSSLGIGAPFLLLLLGWIGRRSSLASRSR